MAAYNHRDEEAMGSSKDNSDKEGSQMSPQHTVGRGDIVGEVERNKAAMGDAHFHRLGWKRLTIVLIVEAIALGSLSIPSAFAALGMVAGVITCVGLGLVAIVSDSVLDSRVSIIFKCMTHINSSHSIPATSLVKSN